MGLWPFGREKADVDSTSRVVVLRAQDGVPLRAKVTLRFAEEQTQTAADEAAERCADLVRHVVRKAPSAEAVLGCELAIATEVFARCSKENAAIRTVELVGLHLVGQPVTAHAPVSAPSEPPAWLQEKTQTQIPTARASDQGQNQAPTFHPTNAAHTEQTSPYAKKAESRPPGIVQPPTPPPSDAAAPSTQRTGSQPPDRITPTYGFPRMPSGSMRAVRDGAGMPEGARAPSGSFQAVRDRGMQGRVRTPSGSMRAVHDGTGGPARAPSGSMQAVHDSTSGPLRAPSGSFQAARDPGTMPGYLRTPSGSMRAVHDGVASSRYSERPSQSSMERRSSSVMPPSMSGRMPSVAPPSMGGRPPSIAPPSRSSVRPPVLAAAARRRVVAARLPLPSGAGPYEVARGLTPIFRDTAGRILVGFLRTYDLTVIRRVPYDAVESDILASLTARSDGAPGTYAASHAPEIQRWHDAFGQVTMGKLQREANLAALALAFDGLTQEGVAQSVANEVTEGLAGAAFGDPDMVADLNRYLYPTTTSVATKTLLNMIKIAGEDMPPDMDTALEPLFASLCDEVFAAAQIAREVMSTG